MTFLKTNKINALSTTTNSKCLDHMIWREAKKCCFMKWTSKTSMNQISSILLMLCSWSRRGFKAIQYVLKLEQGSTLLKHFQKTLNLSLRAQMAHLLSNLFSLEQSLSTKLSSKTLFSHILGTAFSDRDYTLNFPLK